jgi:hypothetical protein
MLKVIKTWREKRCREPSEPVGVFDDQLLADLGLSWEDVRDARIKCGEKVSEGAVFP